MKIKTKICISMLSAGLLTASISMAFINSSTASKSSVSDNSKISLHASYIDYETVNALDSDAELIVIGTPLKNFDNREHVVTNFDDGAVQDFYTLTDIKVDKIIKAPESSTLKTDEDLTIIEPISYIESDQGKRKITYEDYTELKQNEKSIIFLKQNTQGVYSVINMDLGKFPLSDTSEISRSLTSEEHNSKEEFRKEVLEKYDLES